MGNLADQTRYVEGLIRAHYRNEIDRREFISLAGTVSAAAILAACSTGTNSPSSNTGSQSGPKNIPMYSAESEPSNLAFFVSVIGAFQKLHPDVQIAINYYGDKDAATFLDTALRAGHDVGIFGPPQVLVPDWARAGFLLPLDDIIKAAGGRDAYLPGTLVTINGHDYSSPYQSNSELLYYRKDLFQKAGINTPPTNYPDLISALKEVTGRSGLVGTAVALTPGQADLSVLALTPWVLQQGTGYFGYDGTLTFDRPEVLDAIKNCIGFLKYSNQALYNANNNDVISAYVSGRVATAWYEGRLGFNLQAQAPNLADVTDVMPLPAGPFMTGQLTMTASKGYCIGAKTAWPTEAQQFLTFLNSGDNAVQWSLTVPGQLMPGLKSLQEPFTNPATTNKFVAANAFMKKRGSWVNLFAQLVASAGQEEFMMGAVENKVYNPRSNINPWGKPIWGAPTVDGTMLQEVLIQGKSVDQAWKDATAKMVTARKNYLAKNPNWKPG
jgi:multiple sugar transport system substrate-binding protein